jgi:transposase
MRVEVLSGVERRRRWSDDEKARIIEETLVPGARVAEVARRHGVSASLVFGWRRLARDGLLGRGVPALVPVEIVAPVPALPAPTPSSVPRPRRSAGLIEIELSQGRRLRVGPDVDGDALRRVLDALDRR